MQQHIQPQQFGAEVFFAVSERGHTVRIDLGVSTATRTSLRLSSRVHLVRDSSSHSADSLTLRRPAPFPLSSARLLQIPAVALWSAARASQAAAKEAPSMSGIEVGV